MATVGAGFFLLAVLAVALALLVNRGRAYDERVVHTLEVEAKIGELQTLLERAEAARRGYLLRRDERFLTLHTTSAAGVGQAVSEVAALTADNPRQQVRLVRLRTLLNERATQRDRTIRLAGDGNVAGAVAAFNGEAAVRSLAQARALLQEMVEEERRLLSLREARRDAGRVRTYVVSGVAGVLLLLLGVGSVVVLRRYTDDLASSRDALRRLNVGLEGAVATRTADLQRANEEIQRFAYIVSHDLRSPLVNVMGFTSEIEASLPGLRGLMERADAVDPQLVGADARTAITADLPESIGFIRAATGRMDRLINAILRLSREGRRTLNPEPLNMTVLLDGVASGHRSRADAAGAAITVQWPMPDLVGDRLAMEQVFGNLVDNALKYLRPDTPGRIVVRGRRDGHAVVFEVEDNGRGIAPADHERVFDLFRRAGVQDQAGEGIGLAHVRALVHRLGGAITVASELDQGAVFRVSLPAVFQAAKGTAA